MIEEKKPNLFIVGAPKAGTTSLYNYLEEHPEVFMCDLKETNYFSYKEIKNQDLFYNEEKVNNIDDYLALFKSIKQEKIIGEASVSYLFYEDVPGRLFDFNSQSKIIIVLRNPIDRGFSHYLMDSRLGLVDHSYDDIVDKNIEDKRGELYYQQYVELGLYHNQVKRYLDIFGHEQVKIILFEELVDDIAIVVKDLFRFLEVDSNFEPQLSKKYNTFKEPKNKLIDTLYKIKSIRKSLSSFLPETMKSLLLSSVFEKGQKPRLQVNTKDKLISIYRDDVISLEKLLNKDLKDWYE
ncbi:sulfotransferase family protein [Gracilimonas sp. Q87]|uniref:sulfotransferase family protein n=1 Tax=Gracilimonas sp. Q87 TaxID=3384766 RepID=UPI0039841DDE